MGLNDGLVTRIVNIAMSIKLKGHKKTTLHEVLNAVGIKSIDHCFTLSRGDLAALEKALLDLKKDQA